MNFELFATYNDFIILLRKSPQPLWSDSGWQVLFAALNSLVESWTELPSMDVTKLHGHESKSVPLGRILWGPEASRTWNRVDGRFVELQLFTPERQLLLKRGGFPQLYIHLEKVFDAPEAKALYDSLLHIAVRKREMRRHGEHLQRSLNALRCSGVVAAAYSSQVRVKSLNRFEDITLEDFTYRGMLDHPLPDVEQMRRPWEELA